MFKYLILRILGFWYWIGNVFGRNMTSTLSNPTTAMQLLKVFLVDDDPFFLNITEQYLNNLGITDVTLFDNGTECLARLSEKPDVIFLDYNMDTLTGMDVLKKIKRFDPNTYVVVLSAQEEVKPAVDLLKYGAFDYMQKNDVNVERIEEVLNKIVHIQDVLESKKKGFLKNIVKMFAL